MIETAWVAVGFLAQAMFTARFLVQWVVSERRRESTIPTAFWYLSLAGGVLLLAYALWRRDPVFVLGQSTGLVVYIRNIILIRRRGRPHTPRPNGQAALLWSGLALFALVMAFAFQGTRGLTEPDEGRYSEVAREMLVSGDFVTPQLDFKPHFTKPPLTYWCIAASMRLFGTNEWSARLFLSLAYACTVLLVAATGIRLWDRRAGMLAGLIYATSITPYVGASIVTPDTLLVLWETLALWAFFQGRHASSAEGRWGWPALTGVAFGLAFLTKGPPGLLFLPMMFLAWRLLPSQRSRSAPVLNFSGTVSFLVVGLGWYAVAASRHPGLIDYWWHDELLGRMAGQHHRNAEWYGALAIYLPTLTVGALPWSLLWPSLWRRTRSEVRSSGWAPFIRGHVEISTLALLALGPLVLLSLARSRLPLYVLPLFVPLALITARAIVTTWEARTPWVWPIGSLRWTTRLAAWSLLLIGARLVYATVPVENDARRLFASLPWTEEVEIVVDDAQGHYGLAFYTRKDLVRVAGPDDESSSDPTLDEEIAEILKPNCHAHLFLVRPEARRALNFKLETVGATILESRELPQVFAVLTAGRGTEDLIVPPARGPTVPRDDTDYRHSRDHSAGKG